MVLDIEVNVESVKKLEKFLGTGKYKDLAMNTQSFSRKLNEERKMRLPYVDGQVSDKIFNFLICVLMNNNIRLGWLRSTTTPARRERVRGCQAPGQVRSTPILSVAGRRRVTSISSTSCCRVT